MALGFHFFSVIATVTLWFAISHSFMASAQSDGTASFNPPPYQPSACYGYEDVGVMITAVSDELWNKGAVCGEMYEVSCVGGTNAGTPNPCLGSGSVTVMVVDHCPNGCRGRTFDLSQEAFASIADLNSGVINISYQQANILVQK